jgi:flagellar protein FlaG
MAREVVTTSILMIAAVVAATMAITVMMPAVQDLAHSYTSVSGKLSDRIQTDAEIIFVRTSEVNSSIAVDVWIKNLGKSMNVDLLRKGDIFISSDNYYSHITNFSVSIENGDGNNYWDYGETAKLTFQLEDTLSGDYTITYVFYNGVKISDVFSR